MTEVHAVDLIAKDIKDAMLELAPRLPTEIEYTALVHYVVAKHGYYVARMGRDSNGDQYLQVQELQQCANLGHCRHIREYNLPDHACCNCKTVKNDHCYRCTNPLPTTRWWLNDGTLTNIHTGEVVQICGTCVQAIARHNGSLYSNWQITTNPERPRAYGVEHPSGVLVETPELFARFRAKFAQGQ